jgi:hypothetical protein
MRQLQLFTSAELAGMRDRTASRNYSPERDEFRREHERHRAWGLIQRHGERLRRLRDSSCASRSDQTRPPSVPPQQGQRMAASSNAPTSRDSDRVGGTPDDAVAPARKSSPPATGRVTTTPSLEGPNPRQSDARRRNRRFRGGARIRPKCPTLRPRPQSIPHPLRRNHWPPFKAPAETVIGVPPRSAIRQAEIPPMARGPPSILTEGLPTS